MKYSPTDREKQYINGLRNAESKGFAASQDEEFTERDNPYSRFEYSQSWLQGFRRGRQLPGDKGGAA